MPPTLATPLTKSEPAQKPSILREGTPMLNSVSLERIIAALTIVVICAITVLSPNQSCAQVAGATLSGTISAPTGAVIPTAQVSIKDTATGTIRTVTANSAGSDTVPNSTPAAYDLTVSLHSFRPPF